MSKKLTQLWGLETSPCSVPRSLWKVHGWSREGVGRNPAAWSRAQTVNAQGERTTVEPPTSIWASHCATVGGPPGGTN